MRSRGGMYQSRGRGSGERGDSEFEEKVVQVNRVSKKTKGGNQMSFSVLVVVGDKKGKVGVGLGKAKDVLSGIKKGVRRARSHMISVSMRGSTIPFPMNLKWGAARVVLRPAPEGTGIIAGGAVRAVLDAAGVRDVVSKILGTNNKATNVYATFEALKRMNALSQIKGVKGSDLPKRSDPSRPVMNDSQLTNNK